MLLHVFKLKIHRNKLENSKFLLIIILICFVIKLDLINILFTLI
jgi:hypothetical protein